MLSSRDLSRSSVRVSIPASSDRASLPAIADTDESLTSS